MNRRLLFSALLASLMLAGCGSGLKSKSNVLEGTLLAYERALRWGNFSEASSFLDPDSEASKSVKAIDLERLAQFEVKGYRRQTQVSVDKSGIARQIVEIEFVNRHTLSPKTVIDQQAWRYNRENSRWLLITGLPQANQVTSQ
jgi:hypothetical protein